MYQSEVYILNLILITSACQRLVGGVDKSLNIKTICQISTERYPDEDHNINEILHTYKLCSERIDKYSGEAKDVLLKQLINKLDCFKEDLKQLYYEGNLRYKDVQLVESMEQELQNKGEFSLRMGNVRSSSIKCNVVRQIRSTVKHIIPLVVTGTTSEKRRACEGILKHNKGGNVTLADIPTPKFDSNMKPTELTVPLNLTGPSTYKVNSPDAENVLTQYYKLVMKCLTLTTEHKIQVFKFNKKFYDWLTQAVLPHLKDDKCYPAFGGVLRIIETMRENDFVPKNATANFIFYRQKNLGIKEEKQRKKEENPGRIISSPTFYWIWFSWAAFAGVAICFLAWRKKEFISWCCVGDNAGYSDSSTEVFYYPIEDSPSVSLDLDDVVSEPPYSQKSSKLSEKLGSAERLRQQGDLHLYSMMFEEESTLIGLPMKKRRWLDKDVSSSSNELKSQGKRQKRTWQK